MTAADVVGGSGPPPPDQVCNVCQDPETPTYEAGGLWWCDGCAATITAQSASLTRGDLAKLMAAEDTREATDGLREQVLAHLADHPNPGRPAGVLTDAEARARRKGLTPGRRKALATLMHAKRHNRPCTSTNMTTAPNRWATMPLFVHHAAADWLVSEAYATGSLLNGQDHIALTATGVHLAEQEGL